VARPIFVSAFLALPVLFSAACSGGHRDGSASSEGASPGTPAAEGTPGAAPSGRGATLTIKGSDTMVILAQRWAEAYMRGHAGATIQVSGGGSGTGIAALLNGTTDIADASRAMKDGERAHVRERGHGDAVETKVALDAIGVYVNENNSIAHLDFEQLRRIFKGEVTNWSQIGGADRPIVLYSRENNSGTYAFFKEHVLENADFATTAQTLPGTAAVINAVARDPGGIGYGGIAYGSGVRHVPIVGANGGDPIEPSLENAVSGRYPLSRFLFMYTAGPPTGLGRQFIDWVVSPEGQALVENVGYYPLPRAGATAQR